MIKIHSQCNIQINTQNTAQSFINLFLIEIQSMKAEQPLRGMELQEKKSTKRLKLQEICLERIYSKR